MPRRTEDQKALRRTPEERAKANAYAKRYRARPEVHEKHLQTVREYQEKNREAISNRRRAKYAESVEKRRMHKSGNLEWLYGITLEQYEQMLEQQNGLCIVCGRPGTDCRRKHLSVDHDHKTGKVRGLLCNGCNTALGLLRENPNAIAKLLEYVLCHSS